MSIMQRPLRTPSRDTHRATRKFRTSAEFCLVLVAGFLALGAAPWLSQQTGPVTSQPKAQATGQATNQPAGQATAQPTIRPSSQQGPPIAVEVKMVKMLATVRDKKGHLINNLAKDDFAAGAGRPRADDHLFCAGIESPLTLGLLVDTSMSQRRVLGQEREREPRPLWIRFCGKEKDKAFVIHFDHEVELLQDFTSSRKKLEACARPIETPEFAGCIWRRRSERRRRRRATVVGGHHHGRRDVALRCGLFGVERHDEQTGGAQSGDRAFRWRGSRQQGNAGSAIESAQRANTIVYSILFKDDEAFGSHGGYGGGRTGWGGMGGAAWVAEGGVVIRRNSGRTGRKFWSAFRRKRAGGFLK